MKSEADLVWTDGSVMNYTKARPSGHSKELCFRMTRKLDYSWADMSCNTLYHYICKLGKMLSVLSSHSVHSYR